MKIEFKDAKALLDHCGIRYSLEYEYRGEGANRKSHEVEIFDSILIPLSPEDWWGLCRSEEEHYVGGCCGNMSAVQDQLNNWFRFHKYVPAHELVAVGEAMRDHGDICEGEFSDDVTLGMLKEFAEWYKEPTRLLIQEYGEGISPWKMIAFCYQLVKHCYSTGRNDVSASGEHLTPLEEAFSVVTNVATSMCYGRIFGDNGPPKVQDKAIRIRSMMNFGPAIKLLAERFKETVPEPVEGWAFIDLKAGEDRVATWSNVVRTRGGFAIMATKDEADELMTIWEENYEAYEGEGKVRRERPKDRYQLRPVRISMDEGLVFLDRAPHPPLRWPAGKKKPGWLRDEEPVEDRLYEIWAKQWAYDPDDHKGSGARCYEHAKRAWYDAAAYYGGVEEE